MNQWENEATKNEEIKKWEKEENKKWRKKERKNLTIFLLLREANYIKNLTNVIQSIIDFWFKSSTKKKARISIAFETVVKTKSLNL